MKEFVWAKGHPPVRDAWFVEISIPGRGRWHANIGEDFTAYVNRNNRWVSAESHFATMVAVGRECGLSSLVNPAEEFVSSQRMVSFYPSGEVKRSGGA